jgi:hypothetical protein
MTELLISLMNAPRAVQRSVALGISFLLVGTIVVLVTSLGSIISDKASNIDSMRGELFRLNQFISRKPPKPIDATSRPVDENLFLDGSSLPIIHARLQERINATTSEVGVTVASISGMQSIQINGEAYVGVRADIEGDFRSFHEVIRRVEGSMPPLFIREISIRNTSAVSQDVLSGPLHLAGQIVVFGAVSPAVNLKDIGTQ